MTSTTRKRSSRVDVLVLGGGMSGLCAALAAADAGASVLVIESDDVVGGSARWSAGRIWTYADLTELRQRVPLGDASLQRVLTENFLRSLAWLETHGLKLDDQPEEKEGSGKLMTGGRRGDQEPWLRDLGARVAEAGARIICGATATVERGFDGQFLAQVRSRGGTVAVSTGTLVVATGGFHASREHRRRFLGPGGDDLMVRSSRHCNGGGIDLGRKLGGAMSRGTASFYGHTMPAVGGEIAATEFKSLTLGVATEAVLVNQEGSRFVDETAARHEESNALAAMHQPRGLYYLIGDKRLSSQLDHNRLRSLSAPKGPPIVLEDDSLDGLMNQLVAKWGIGEAGLARTKEAVLRAAERGDPMQLLPYRQRLPLAFGPKPHFAIRCKPSISFSYGGLHVDSMMRPMNASGQPVSGLFAAGVDAGGVYVDAYAGGLSWALVSGRIAGAGAATTADNIAQRRGR